MPLRSNIPRVARALESACDDAAQQAAQRLLDERNQRVPIDTGQLRDSGSITQIEAGVWRFSEGEGLPDARAAFTEYGTSNPNYPAQPHVWPAVEIVRKDMPQIAVSDVKRAIS